jgi:MYXO-CTERM domain-containing protein
LVHPELVIFAAHCMQGSSGPSKATFGDNENSPAFSVSTKGCKAHPKYPGTSGNDMAYCRLSQAVTQVPIVPILMGCETQVLVPGASVVAVGFGQANDGLGWGPKREVTMALNSIKNNEAFIGGAGKDTCYGDSGGPVYVQLSDGSWRVFGITSYGEYCGGGGYYSMMHTTIDWVEQNSGLDLTPCHQQGQWAPTAACGSFPKSPGVGGMAWSAKCATSDLSALSATCGSPYGGGGGGSGGAPPGGGGAPSGGGGSGGVPPGGGGGSGGVPSGGGGGSGGVAPGGGGANSGGTPGFGGGNNTGGYGAGSSGGGGEGNTAGVGGGSAGGGGGVDIGSPGCSTAPDCNACSSCTAHCTCATGDAQNCAVACAPYGPNSGPGGPSVGPEGVPSHDNGEVTAGCACRSSAPTPPTAPLALFTLALIGSTALRRRR